MTLRIGQTVVTSYKVDTRDAQQSVKKLQSTEKTRALAAAKQLKAQNDGLEKHIATIGKIGVGIAALAGAWKTASVGLDKYRETAQMTAAAGNADIGGIVDSMRGLISETEALSFAATVQNGAFEVSQRQMELAGRAMVSLRNQNNDLDRVIQQVTKALVEGSTEALKEFGVIIKAETGSVEGFEGVMRALEDQTRNSKAEFNLAGDDILRASKKMEDATRRIQEAFGRIAAAAGPLIEKLAGVAQKISDIVSEPQTAAEQLALDKRNLASLTEDIVAAERFLAKARGSFLEDFAKTKLKDLKEELSQLQLDIEVQASRVVKLAPTSEGGTSLVDVRAEEAERKRKEAERKRKEAKLKAARERRRKQREAEDKAFRFGDEDELVFSVQESLQTAQDQALADRFGERSNQAAIDNEATQQLLENSAMLIAAKVEEQKAFEASMKQFEQMAEVGSIASGILQAAGGQAFNAWISGAKSLEEATRDMFLGFLKGLANKLLGVAIEQAVMGAVMIAAGNPVKAGAHFIAAAQAGAGAVTIGGLTRVFGGSGGRGGGGGFRQGGRHRPFATVDTQRRNVGRESPSNDPFVIEAGGSRSNFGDPTQGAQPLVPPVQIINIPETIGTRTPEQQATDIDALLDNVNRRMGGGRNIQFR